MKFFEWLEHRVLAHISGPSGSGKTTLANKLSISHPGVVFKDLDDFDDEATSILKFDGINKQNYTDKMLEVLAKKRQDLMNDFIEKSTKPIVFVGNHTEGDYVLNIPTKNRFMLNVDARTSAMRAYLRSQKEDPKFRRTLDELPEDQKEAQEVIDWLIKNGYKPLSDKQIAQWLDNY